MMSYVYIKTEPQLWTVGHYDPEETFHAESDWPTEAKAADRVHYLNGATKEKLTMPVYRNDPYPDQLVLTTAQVAKLFGMTSSEFRDFVPAGQFPKPAPFGKMRSGKPRLRWPKADVYRWFDELSKGSS